MSQYACSVLTQMAQSKPISFVCIMYSGFQPPWYADYYDEGAALPTTSQ